MRVFKILKSWIFIFSVFLALFQSAAIAAPAFHSTSIDPEVREFFENVTLENYEQLSQIHLNSIPFLGELMLYAKLNGANKAEVDRIFEKYPIPSGLNSTMNMVAALTAYEHQEYQFIDEFLGKIENDSPVFGSFACSAVENSLAPAEIRRPQYKKENLEKIIPQLSSKAMLDTPCSSIWKDGAPQNLTVQDLLERDAPDLLEKIKKHQSLKAKKGIKGADKEPVTPPEVASLRYCSPEQLKGYIKGVLSEARDLKPKHSLAFSNKNERCQFTGRIRKGKDNEIYWTYIGNPGEGIHELGQIKTADSVLTEILNIRKFGRDYKAKQNNSNNSSNSGSQLKSRR